MKKSVGKYNVWNKISKSEGTPATEHAPDNPGGGLPAAGRSSRA
jgi:hypothetical protein